MLMKKRVWGILISCFAVVIVTCIVGLYFAFGFIGKTSAKKYSDPTASVDYYKAKNHGGERTKILLPEGRDLKILILSDPQAYNGDKYDVVGGNTEKTYAFVERLVGETAPDLTVITGDLVHCIKENQWGYMQRYAEIFERQKTLWAIAFGNHDCEYKYVKKSANIYTEKWQISKEKMVKALWEYPHSLTYVQREGDGYHYAIDLVKGEETVRRLLFMDCENALVDGKKEYSKTLSQKGLSFYEKTVTEGVKSTLFMHVGLPEYYRAANLLGEGVNDGITVHYGLKMQGDYSNVDGGGVFSLLKEKKSTDSVFFGHHHDNDLSLTYQGIRMTSVQHSGFSHGYRTDISEQDGKKVIDFRRILTYGDDRGGVLLTVNEKGEYKQIPVYGRELLPEYEEEFAIDYGYYIDAYAGKAGYRLLLP